MGMRLSPVMEKALVAIAHAMPLVGDESLALLPCKGQTANALEDRKLINWKSAPEGIRWFLTDAGWDMVERLTDTPVARTDEKGAKVEGGTVIVSGNRVHAPGVPCGTCYDDDKIYGLDTTADTDCYGCLSQPKELTAGDGTVIMVGSRVTSVPPKQSKGAPATGTVTSLAEYVNGEWAGLVTVVDDADGLPYGYHWKSLATFAPEAPELITGHDAESHSRRGHECRICGQPVVDHARPNISDGLASCYWSGTVAGDIEVPGRVAQLKAWRAEVREARDLADALLAEIEAPQTLSGDDLSMIDDAADLDAHFGRPAPVDPWRSLRGKRKATKVTRRAWQSELNRRSR
jgi:hypothetical protein